MNDLKNTTNQNGTLPAGYASGEVIEFKINGYEKDNPPAEGKTQYGENIALYDQCSHFILQGVLP